MGNGGQQMTIVEGILIGFILFIGVISMFGDSKNKAPKSKEDKDLARMRQMQEWDRFDDTKK
jgi:hypothetical protein